ncbi:hypothetical protein VN97_g10368 [Penicillium thymicola]|uniref:Uncharacterized protein n=1 Tax=Penicillium thymicola TaxID=293382 RepID=A0AAI9T9P9_PENTH|nr:hypothetical protein VN97_g10368 [Penicillium thymicola]
MYLVPGCSYLQGPVYTQDIPSTEQTNLADLEVKCGERLVLASRTYTPDFRPSEMDFPFRFSAHPLPLFAH